MSYKAKTDWQYDDVVTENDMNRIEGGIQENKQGLAAHLADFTQHVNDGSAHGIGNKSSLQTIHKTTIVGAINEVFQSGNNVKQSTVDALLSVDDSLPITSSNSWSDIIGSIGQISTGKKFATGTALSSPEMLPFVYAGTTQENSRYYITVSGIDFKPSLLIITSEESTSRYLSIYTEGTDSYYEKTVKVTQFTSSSTTSSSFNFKADGTLNAFVDNGNFLLPVSSSKLVFTWMAYE